MQTLVQSANSIWQRSKHGAWTLDHMFFLVLGNGRLKKLRSASSASMLGLEELAGIVEQHGVPAAGEQQRPQARCGGNELSLDELANCCTARGACSSAAKASGQVQEASGQRRGATGQGKGAWEEKVQFSGWPNCPSPLQGHAKKA